MVLRLLLLGLRLVELQVLLARGSRVMLASCPLMAVAGVQVGLVEVSLVSA